MKSLHSRLTVWQVGGAGLLLVLGALVLSRIMDLRLQREFDTALLAKARSLVTVTEQKKGRVWMEGVEALPELAGGPNPDYFQAWYDDGRVIERSSSLGSGNLPRQRVPLDQPLLYDHRLPDGTLGRFVEIRFIPRFIPRHEE